MATPRQTASAGGLNEVRGRCILNHRWADRAPSALAGSRSRGGSPRSTPTSEVGNAEPLGAQVLHYALHFRFMMDLAYDKEEEEDWLLSLVQKLFPLPGSLLIQGLLGVFKLTPKCHAKGLFINAGSTPGQVDMQHDHKLPVGLRKFAFFPKVAMGVDKVFHFQPSLVPRRVGGISRVVGGGGEGGSWVVWWGGGGGGGTSY